MSLEGHTTCPHCKALTQSTICTICGKSAFEEVEAAPEREHAKWWRDNPEVRKVTRASVLIAAILAAGAVWWFARSPSEPTATALPPPATTTTVAIIETSGRAPSVQGALSGSDTVDIVAADRQVDEGLSPWETPPPIDFVTGRLIDEDVDYSADIARVDEVLAAFAGEWDLSPLDPPQILTFGGAVELEPIETTQPFAARTITRGDGLDVGEVWLIASSGTEPGDAYLASARSRWDVAGAIDNFSPAVGIRVWRLGTDATTNLWATDLSETAFVLVQAPLEVSPRVLTDALEAWREEIGE